MPKISITVEDLKSILTMEAGWRKIKVKSVEHAPSSKKDSMNYTFTFDVDYEPGDVRQIQYWVNDKNRKMFILGLTKLYEGLFNVTLDDDKPIEMEPETWIGLECWGEITKDIVNNRVVNNVIGFSGKVPF